MRSAIVAIALALVPFVTVVEVSGGMIAGITSRYLEIGSFHLQIRFFKELDTEAIEGMVASVRSLPGVLDAFLVVQGVGLVYKDERRVGVTVRSYPPEFTENDSAFGRYVEIEGAFTPDGAAVSKGVVEAMDVVIGDTIGLVVARTLSSGRFVLKTIEAPVTAIYSTGYADLDGHSVIISRSDSDSLYPGSENRFIGIKVADPFGDLGAVASGLQESLASGAYVYSWRELERGMYTTFQTTRSLLIIIMGVIVAVAAITISSSLVILVTEREVEIALLRSLGATASRIRRTFLMLGGAAGAIGSTAGVVVGLFVSLRVNELFRFVERFIEYALRSAQRIGMTDAGSPVRILDPAFYLERIPVEPSFSELLAIVAAGILLSTLSAWLPARRAGRIDPSSVLSHH